jgi:large conductance mechanosensitive channel
MSRSTTHLLDFDGDGDLDFNDLRTASSHFWSSFADFALRDNVLEVAVGLMYVYPLLITHHKLTSNSFASSFTAVANSLVSDIILPIVSLLPFLSRNIGEKFLILRKGQSHTWNYNTIEQALKDGAVVWAWGSFVDKVLRFVIIALALFMIASMYSRITHDNIIKRQVRCKFCRKYISEKAKRCVYCTSWLDGRDEKPAPAASAEDGH